MNNQEELGRRTSFQTLDKSFIIVITMGNLFLLITVLFILIMRKGMVWEERMERN